MKYRVKLHRLAERDLNDIYDFIAADNPIAALRYARRIKAHCESLSRMPKRGAPREDLGPGLRTLPFEGRVTVAYRFDGEIVLILRLLYGGRDFPEDWPSLES